MSLYRLLLVKIEGFLAVTFAFRAIIDSAYSSDKYNPRRFSLRAIEIATSIFAIVFELRFCILLLCSP